MNAEAQALWRDPALKRAAGQTLRPGGFALTDRAVELAMKMAGLRPGMRVLDVGCGPGASVLRLRSRHGARAVGLDPDPERVENVPLVRARAQALPFATARLDMVLCECVLSLVPDPDAALAEFARTLKPGGTLALSDLYRKTPDRVRECGPFSSCVHGAMTRPDLEARLERAGFRTLLFEDHSRLLRDLAVRLAWQGLSPGCGPGATGYALVLAVSDQPTT